MVRSIAARPEANGLIGTRLSVATLSPDPSEPPLTKYVSDKISDTIYTPNHIVANKAGTLSIAKMKITAPGSSLHVPKVGRNQRCPCGSGKKYKHCHGRRT